MVRYRRRGSHPVKVLHQRLVALGARYVQRRLAGALPDCQITFCKRSTYPFYAEAVFFLYIEIKKINSAIF